MKNETELQNACMRYLDSIGIRYLHKYNYSGQKNRKSVHKKFKGWPDLTIPVKEYTIYIELKMPGKKLLPEQEDWRDYFIEFGHPWYLVYDVETFISIIQKHL